MKEYKRYYLDKDDMEVAVYEGVVDLTFKTSINLCDGDILSYEIPWKKIAEAWHEMEKEEEC